MIDGTIECCRGASGHLVSLLCALCTLQLQLCFGVELTQTALRRENPTTSVPAWGVLASLRKEAFDLRSSVSNRSPFASEAAKVFPVIFNISLTVLRREEVFDKWPIRYADALKPADCISGILKQHVLTSWSLLTLTFVSYAILALFSILVIGGCCFIKDRRWRGNRVQTLLGVMAGSQQHLKCWNLAVN